METRKDQTKMVPPDGGWGWLIVLGSCLITISTAAIEPSFGLLFGDLFKQLGVGTSGASLVVSILMAILCFTGLIIGPLIKKFTYRKVAIAGGLISATAILLTVPVNSMLHLIITFGVLGGIGFGLVISCSMVGINLYFSKRKGQAIGISMTGSTMGFILMPQIVRFFLEEYDFRSAILIIGAISLHAVVGASLFQPVRWHYKVASIEVQEKEAHTLLPSDKIEEKDGSKDEVTSIISSPNIEERKKLSNIPSQAFSPKESVVTNISVDAENTLHLQEINVNESEKEFEGITDHSDVKESNMKNKPKRSVKSRLSRFSKFMDLDLLRDGVYLNILFGLSMSELVEMNFKFILPFYLSNLGFTYSEIAYALSSMAVSDIFARLVVPPIMDRTSYTRRITFLFGSLCVVFGRSCITLLTSIGSIITTLVIVGFFRGIYRTSYPLVLTEYSTGGNFPSVLGLSMVFKGISVLILGPGFGYLRDVTGSYSLFIHSQTLLMILVAISWILERIILKSKDNKQEILHS